MLSNYLTGRGIEAVRTREPGGVSIAEQLREMLLNPDNLIFPRAELMLYASGRAQHTEERILPALREGKFVICERYTHASIAYQGYGRDLDLEALRAITRFATGGLVPDITFLLDIDVQEGLNRRINGADEMNRLDLEAIAFHQRVRDGYHQMAAAEPDRWVVVDAGQSPEEIQRELRAITLDRLG